MVSKHTSPRVLFPQSINEALQMAAGENSPVFWAGGTGITASLKPNSSLLNLPKVIISLRMLDELTRASRSELGMEIGSMVTLDRLASIRRRILPPGLPETLALTGNKPLRCRATLGGHIAQALNRKEQGCLLPLLQLLEATVEIRYLRERPRRKPVSAVKRIPLTQLENEEGLGSSQLITRVNIPASSWNFVVVEKLPSSESTASPLLFHSLARIEKSVLTDWRAAVSDATGRILRNRETEAVVSGRSLPFSARDRSALEDGIKWLTKPWEDRPEDCAAVLRLAFDFMRKAAE
ncbi:MAG: hypothetical protein CSA76_04945 [Spirochaetales bacterium]|nr:MAG: hypothetical protein CSA76_04945 [Spirochaetales bacterium]